MERRWKVAAAGTGAAVGLTALVAMLFGGGSK